MKAGTHPLVLCPACGGEILQDVVVRCSSCSAEYGEASGILLLHVEGNRTALDDIDYDEVYHVDAGASAHVVQTCLQILGDRIPDRIGNFLEIGAGTGLFTLGFLNAVAVDCALITDISPGMLGVCRKRLESGGVLSRTATQFATWDGARACFRPDSFDLVAGFSVIHHILDYATLFCHLRACIRPGGFALFLEPNYRFQTVLVDFVVELYGNLPPDLTIWTTPDRQRLLSWLYENHTNLRFRGDAFVLADREDKHVFEGAELRSAAKAAGFADVELIPFGDKQDGYTAIQVYAAQLGFSEAARADLIERFARHLPGPFAHLTEEDRAASSLILLKTVASPLTPLAPTADFIPADLAESFLFDLIITLVHDDQELSCYVLGWVLGDVDLTYLVLRSAAAELRFPIHQMRPDVQTLINPHRRYPLRRALFSGISSGQRFRDASRSDVSVRILVIGLDGRERLLGVGTLAAGETRFGGAVTAGSATALQKVGA